MNSISLDNRHPLRRLPAILTGALVLLLMAIPADAFININLQMQLGNPSGASADTNNHNSYLIQRSVEALDYSDNLGQPVWASWDLTAGDVGNATRSTVYFTDTNLPPNFYRVTTADYNGVGAINFNRGHLCPSEDRTDTKTDNDLLFFMSNIMPQAAVNNQGVWGNFEGYCRDLTASNELLIICGPSGFGTNRIPSGKAVIADFTWKIAVVVPTNNGTALSRITAATRVISLKIPNSNTVSSAWQNYVTSANQIQTDTGFTFFTALPAAVASALRNKVDGQTNQIGSPGFELDIAAIHAGNFTQGDPADIYTLFVTNIGTLTSTGTVSVVNNLPTGLSATALGGTGWNANLATLTCTRSDALVAGAGYPPITVTVKVATNAPTIVTNVAVVSGGGDAIPDTATDPTTINASSTGGGTYTGILAGWDVSGQTAYGPSPLAPGTNAPNVAITGLTRGSGVSLNGSGAARGWGGVAFTTINVATAVASNQFVTFGVTANTGYQVACTSISRFDYRRSGTGPANGVLQFQVGAGAFTDLTNLAYTSTSTGGSSIGAIDLSGFAALQNVGAGTNVTFRVVNYGGGASGTWYVFDTAGSAAFDLAIQGTVTRVLIATNPPALPPSFTLLRFTDNQFQFTVTGTAGSNYIVQAATDLNASNWLSLTTNAAPFLFIESNANAFNRRFYRGLLNP